MGWFLTHQAAHYHTSLNSAHLRESGCIVWLIVQGHENGVLRPWQTCTVHPGWSWFFISFIHESDMNLDPFESGPQYTTSRGQGSGSHFRTHSFSGTNGPIWSFCRTSPRWANASAKERYPLLEPWLQQLVHRLLAEPCGSQEPRIPIFRWWNRPCLYGLTSCGITTRRTFLCCTTEYSLIYAWA